MLSVISFMLLAISIMRAQTTSLLVKSSPKGLYLEHTVTAKENFYSIGRLYNVHPKHIAGFNNLNMAGGLNTGQLLMIPLSDTNFNQRSQEGLPLYYIVGESEGLLRISAIHHKLPVETIKKWNKLSTDQVNTGQKLIVGYLNSKESAQVAAIKPPVKEMITTPATTVNKDTVITEQVSSTTAPAENLEEPKKTITQTKDTLGPEQVKTTAEIKEIVKTEPKQPVTKPKETPLRGYGYFKSLFELQVKQQPLSKDQTVTSGIFKTSSGWTDEKFYLLVDGIEPGTIVKVTNPTNSKIIYAKVLGEMAGMKQNLGLNMRMSNAAAAALEITETDKFIVRINY
jgi:LysM repeat protein